MFLDKNLSSLKPPEKQKEIYLKVILNNDIYIMFRKNLEYYSNLSKQSIGEQELLKSYMNSIEYNKLSDIDIKSYRKHFPELEQKTYTAKTYKIKITKEEEELLYGNDNERLNTIILLDNFYNNKEKDTK